MYENKDNVKKGKVISELVNLVESSLFDIKIFLIVRDSFGKVFTQLFSSGVDNSADGRNCNVIVYNKSYRSF